MSLLWKVPAGADAYCSRCPIPHGCDPVQLVDKGAAFEGSMRPMLAEACWRRALMMPGVASRSTAVDPQTIGEVARSNLKVIIEQSLQTRQAYLQGFEALPRRGSGSGSSSTSRMRIHIEGWRGLPHSFSVVGLDLANHLAMRPGIDLSWSDAPLFGTMARMKHDAGGMQLDPSVAVLPFGGPLPAGTVLVRVSFPFNLTLSATAARTVVFGVVEFLSAQPDALADLSPWQSVASTVVTPSRWAMEGFVRVGVPRSRLALVPHGVDTSLYRPAAGSSDKAAARAALGVSNLGKRFVFLHVSGLSANKKLPKLAAAFDALLTRWPKDAAPSRPALVIKGLSQLYGSESSFRQAVPRRLVDSGDVVYIGKAMVREELARLYQASDAFVTATCGEGFGLPLLEAAAVGLAVVAPAGGAVEEYTTPDFTRYVRSTLVSLAEGSGPIPDGFSISVDTGELSQEMEFVATSREFQDQAAMAGPKHVARYFTIQNVADQLLGMLQDEQWSTPAV